MAKGGEVMRRRGIELLLSALLAGILAISSPVKAHSSEGEKAENSGPISSIEKEKENTPATQPAKKPTKEGEEVEKSAPTQPATRPAAGTKKAPTTERAKAAAKLYPGFSVKMYGAATLIEKLEEFLKGTTLEQIFSSIKIEILQRQSEIVQQNVESFRELFQTIGLSADPNFLFLWLKKEGEKRFKIALIIEMKEPKKTRHFFLDKIPYSFAQEQQIVCREFQKVLKKNLEMALKFDQKDVTIGEILKANLIPPPCGKLKWTIAGEDVVAPELDYSVQKWLEKVGPKVEKKFKDSARDIELLSIEGLGDLAFIKGYLVLLEKDLLNSKNIYYFSDNILQENRNFLKKEVLSEGDVVVSRKKLKKVSIKSVLLDNLSLLNIDRFVDRYPPLKRLFEDSLFLEKLTLFIKGKKLKFSFQLKLTGEKNPLFGSGEGSRAESSAESGKVAPGLLVRALEPYSGLLFIERFRDIFSAAVEYVQGKKSDGGEKTALDIVVNLFKSVFKSYVVLAFIPSEDLAPQLALLFPTDNFSILESQFANLFPIYFPHTRQKSEKYRGTKIYYTFFLPDDLNQPAKDGKEKKSEKKEEKLPPYLPGYITWSYVNGLAVLTYSPFDSLDFAKAIADRVMATTEKGNQGGVGAEKGGKGRELNASFYFTLEVKKTVQIISQVTYIPGSIRRYIELINRVTFLFRRRGEGLQIEVGIRLQPSKK